MFNSVYLMNNTIGINNVYVTAWKIWATEGQV